MRIFMLYRGPFGEQMVNNLVLRGLGPQTVGTFELKPETLEEEHPGEKDLWNKLWEEPSKYLPKSLPSVKCDLLLVLGLHSRLGDLIPPIAEKMGVRSILYPIDDRQHLPEGKKTIQEELERRGVHVEFPEPFCALEGSEDPLIREFSLHFGKPRFRVKREEGRIKAVEVVRDTPCGSAHAVAEKMVGFSCGDLKALKEKLFLEHHNEENENYCLAEMDPLAPYMQEAGDILVDAFFEACGFPTTKDLILQEAERGKVDFEQLKRKLVEEEKRCETERTVRRILVELGLV
ncbi:MAG: DUF166 family protein [Candidatus Hadarchaeales archaeon]